jgi:putative tryptophan/tyrosine transport system substrate-binding protein
MKRREFLTFVSGAVTAWPFAARAQRSMPVIGFLNTASPGPYARLVQAFRDGLAETGYIEGKNVAIEYRWAHGETGRIRGMAAELVSHQVNVIAATGGSTAALAAKAETKTVPIVFQIGVDPVEVGLVASLSNPGGNITGSTIIAVQLGSKRLELLKQLMPALDVVGALVNPNRPGTPTLMHDLRAAADALGLRLQIVNASSEQAVAPAFSELQRLQVGALWIGADPLFNGLSEQLATLSLTHRIPAIYQFRDFAAAGGLASYGGSITDAYRQAGVYSGRILKGDKPSDLPVQQSTKVELILNLKTAKLLGLELPPAMLARADEVIE